MKKPIHQMTMKDAFRQAGAHWYDREREVRREEDIEEDELAAARAWLAHVEAGRIGKKQ
jgi:predicted transcriptional regulator